MTSGQQRAVEELRRLAGSDDGGFELTHDPVETESGLILAEVSLKIGAIATEEGGLPLRDREDFILVVPKDFPFDRPRLRVTHDRFAGFPHVIWGKTLCLYQSSLEWNPSDGLYGFFDRLQWWLSKAAMNDMDPLEGPLEPPHHDTDFSYSPFVVKADAPCKAGEDWTGLALLERKSNRVELIGWDDLSNGWPQGKQTAFAVMLPGTLPMEFPSNGAELFLELANAGMGKSGVLKNLAIAALLADKGEPLFLIVGLPMRRASDGTCRMHIAVWAMNAEDADSLRLTLPRDKDSEELANLRGEFADNLLAVFECRKIKWCQVLEDRPEIVARRDGGTPLAWIAGKKVLLLGCGALGSWTAEILARSGAAKIHLVDSGLVKPGLIVRQNYTQEDIGANKAEALAGRLRSIASSGTEILAHTGEAHAFVTSDPAIIGNFDLLVDCTASSVFQMKLERDWMTWEGQTPPTISMIIDGEAKHCLCVSLQRSSTGGPWSAYLSAKRRISTDGMHPKLAEAFYSGKAMKSLFQPEPGCSDPTFVGSAADVASLAAEALNASLGRIALANADAVFAWSAPGVSDRACQPLELPRFHDVRTGTYRVRIAESVFTQARAWARKSRRERSPNHETGGLLWGFWDDAIGCIWVFDASGPPPDSKHAPAYFLCGVEGTAEEHQRRSARTNGACGFVGHWHTHPAMTPSQSGTDIGSMATLVSAVGGNQRRSFMLIFGSVEGRPAAGAYVYESSTRLSEDKDIVQIGSAEFELPIEIA